MSFNDFNFFSMSFMIGFNPKHMRFFIFFLLIDEACKIGFKLKQDDDAF